MVSAKEFHRIPLSRCCLIFDPTQIPKDGPNRNFPGFDVWFDVNLRQPNRNIAIAGVNLAPLF